MRTIQLEVFKFNELSSKVQRKLIDKFIENLEFDYLYQDFLSCLYTFLEEFNIDKNQIDYSIGAYDYSYIRLKNVENNHFKGMNKEFINAIDNESNSMSYGMSFVQYFKENFNNNHSVKLALEYSFQKTVKDFQDELGSYYEDNYITDQLNDLDHDYLACGKIV